MKKAVFISVLVLLLISLMPPPKVQASISDKEEFKIPDIQSAPITQQVSVIKSTMLKEADQIILVCIMSEASYDSWR